MSARSFREPKSITFDEHRWYVDITIVDRFGVTQVFRADASEDSGNSIVFHPVDTVTGEMRENE